MKPYIPFVLLSLLVSPAVAGNWFGSGPWANGMYYPGQLDGRYFANVYNNLGGTFTRVSTTNTFFTTNEVTTTVISNNIPETITTNIVTGPLFETNTVVLGSVVSGVIGFGIRGGAPAVGGAGAVSSSDGQSIIFDSSLNNFLIYVNGDVFSGVTAANINPKSSRVSGALANGAGRIQNRVITNTTSGESSSSSTVQILSVPTATASGYFNASVNNNRSPYTFNGGGTISIASDASAGIDGTHDFNLNGIKTSDNSASAIAQTSAANNPQ